MGAMKALTNVGPLCFDWCHDTALFDGAGGYRVYQWKAERELFSFHTREEAERMSDFLRQAYHLGKEHQMIHLRRVLGVQPADSVTKPNLTILQP